MGNVGVAVMVDHVGEHEGGGVEPGQATQRRHVGLEREVAIALIPARGGVAGHGLHVDVVGEQIAAGMRLRVCGLEEVLGVKALADELARHIGKGDDDSVDLSGRNRGPQCFQRQHSAH